MGKLTLNTILAAVLVFSAGISQASARSESFRKSCHDIQVYAATTGRVITAVCDAPRQSCEDRLLNPCFGATLPTRLIVPAEGCEDISNRNGTLVCVHASPLITPGGSWSASCSGGRFIQGTIFDAVCKNQVGADEVSQIDLSKCPSNRVRNNYGRLHCE